MAFLNILRENFVITWDVAAVIFIFLGAFLYGFGVSRKKLLFFTLSVYLSAVLLFLFPFFDLLFLGFKENIDLGILKIIILAIFIIMLYYVLSGSFLKLTLPVPHRGRGPYWQTVLLSISMAGFLTSIVSSEIYSLLGKNVSVLVERGFLSQIALFIWALIPILVLLIFRIKNK